MHPNAGRHADRTAILLSFGCILHCIAFPIMVALAPAIAPLFDWPEAVHGWLALVALPISAFAMRQGFRRHRHYVPMLLGGWGLVLIASGAWGGLPHIWEISITIAGALLLAAAHLMNLRRKVPAV